MDEQSGQNPQGTPPQDSTEQKSLGPAIGLVVILLIIIAGSFYFFRGGTSRDLPTPSQTDDNNPSIADIEESLMKLSEENTSDEVSDIEADLELTSKSASEMESDLDIAGQESSQLGY